MASRGQVREHNKHNKHNINITSMTRAGGGTEQGKLEGRMEDETGGGEGSNKVSMVDGLAEGWAKRRAEVRT